MKITRQRSGESGVVSRHKVIKSWGMGPKLWQFRASLSYGARGMASRSLWSEWSLKDVAIFLVHIPPKRRFLQVLLLPDTEAGLSGAFGLLR